MSIDYVLDLLRVDTHAASQPERDEAADASGRWRSMDQTVASYDNTAWQSQRFRKRSSTIQ